MDKQPEKPEYIKLCEEIEDVYGKPRPSFKEKFLKNPIQNSVIITGAGVAIGALTAGLWSLNRGNPKMQQYMMRLRVGAQMFTIMVITAAMYSSVKR